ncbi:amidohydrolase family protein [Pseudoruegeria sp. HB172150]|uniref:amidohydrolase family protein n=1 Tax=Pseudoruegeria sp. HB172150 TaxID=2721164 RepID=UPI0020A66777|nr:amidohydrolase family protein [Pseudoruegeria sp. HB172150]
MSDRKVMSHGVIAADLVLRNALVPSVLCREIGGGAIGEGLVLTDIAVRDGHIVAAAPNQTLVAGEARDLGGRMVLPGFVDMHVHLDKAYTAARTGVSRIGLAEAVSLSMADAPNRTLEDLLVRMDRAIRAAYRLGTVAMRTHLDSMAPPDESPAWAALRRLQEKWQGRMRLQPVALMRIERAVDRDFADRCRQIAERGGLAGGYISGEGCDPAMVDAFLTLAADAGLDVDFHVDETLDAGARGIETVLDSAEKVRFPWRVTLSHCCSLAAMEQGRALAIAERIAAAQAHVVSLPLTNAYLMDRMPGESPRRRGMTIVQELSALGVPVCFASDNVRDAFYPYGAFDMLEIFRQAVMTSQLEADVEHWIASVAARPSETMRLESARTIAPGVPADLVIFDARDWTDLLSRAHEDRQVLRAGVALDAEGEAA